MVCVVLVVGISLLALWYFLSRWDATRSAWEHLPPETAWAVEIHDAKGMFVAAAEDKGVRTFLRNSLDNLDLPLRELDVESGDDQLRSMLEGYLFLTPFFTTILPNTAIMGATSTDSQDFFLILQPPRWFAWFFSGAPGAVETINTSEGITAFLTTLDGWAVLATDRAVLNQVIDSWEKKSSPYGARLALQQPYLHFGGTINTSLPFQLEGKDGRRQAFSGLANQPDAGHFMLRDPFAGMPKGDASSDAVIRIAIAHDNDGWLYWLEKTQSGKSGVMTSLVDNVDADLGRDRPAVSLPDASDMEISLRMSDTARKVFIRNLETLFAPASINVPEPTLLGWRWLRNGWLAHTDSGFSILASRPVAKTEGAYPPAPVVSLGWALDESFPSDVSAKDFADSLGEWFAAVKTAEEPPLLKTIGESVQLTVADDGKGGLVELPSVMVNGARPAWLFNEGMGWLATDPAGLPGLATQKSLRLGTMAKPEGHSLNLAITWDMSRDFLDGTVDVVNDRVESLPDRYFTDISRENVASYIRVIYIAMSAFPNASFTIHYNFALTTVQMKGFIPHGRTVE